MAMLGKFKILLFVCFSFLVALAFGLLGNSPHDRAAEYPEITYRDGEKIPLFPEDVFPFSAQEWRDKKGCSKTELEYVGFFSQDDQYFTILRAGQVERIYGVGDAVGGNKFAFRVIQIAAGNVVVRGNDGVHILCLSRGGNIPISPAAKKSSLRNETTTGVEPSRLLSSVRASGYNAEQIVSVITGEQDSVVGYKINNCLSYCWLLTRYAIQVGDVVTAVQGVPVNSLSTGRLMAIARESKDDVKLTLLRDGKPLSVSLPREMTSLLMRLMK